MKVGGVLLSGYFFAKSAFLTKMIVFRRMNKSESQNLDFVIILFIIVTRTLILIIIMS